MMNINGTNIQIMWKEISIIFLVICSARFVTDFYIMRKYAEIYTIFRSKIWDGLEEKARKLQKLCAIFSGGIFNRKIRQMYNGLCVALASIAFTEQQEDKFLEELNKVKKEEEFELKPFILALYYASKKDGETSKGYYQIYLKCSHTNDHIRVIMEWMFLEMAQKDYDKLEKAIKSFENPIILELFQNNGLVE